MPCVIQNPFKLGLKQVLGSQVIPENADLVVAPFKLFFDASNQPLSNVGHIQFKMRRQSLWKHLVGSGIELSKPLQKFHFKGHASG